jgi:hypothetical protein
MKEEKDVCSLAWGRCEVSCVVSMTENHTSPPTTGLPCGDLRGQPVVDDRHSTRP